MLKLIKADFKKIIYLSSYRYLLLTNFILSLLFGTIFLLTIEVTEGRELSNLTSQEVIDVSFLGTDVTAILMIIFSALFISKDISAGAVHTNLVITPNRLKFFISKILFLSLLSILISLLVITGIFGIDWLIILVNDMGSLSLWDSAVLLKVIGSIIMVLTYSLLSATGAFFIQSMSGGIVFSLGLMFLPALIRFFPEWIGDIVLPIFPETAIGAFTDLTTTSNNLLLAVLLLSLSVIVTSTISYTRFKKTDY